MNKILVITFVLLTVSGCKKVKRGYDLVEQKDRDNFASEVKKWQEITSDPCSPEIISPWMVDPAGTYGFNVLLGRNFGTLSNSATVTVRFIDGGIEFQNMLVNIRGEKSEPVITRKYPPDSKLCRQLRR